jgi:hypothetical protein
MNKLTATFANGRTITRNSKKVFPYAWRSEDKWNVAYGFASSETNAQKAARTAFCDNAKILHSEVVATVVA